MELETTLALYRTRLAEKRTALSQLQLGFVLVTVPVTVHAAFMMIADRHSAPRPAVLSGVGTAVSLVLLVAGSILAAAAIRDLWRCRPEIRSLRDRIERFWRAEAITITVAEREDVKAWHGGEP